MSHRLGRSISILLLAGTVGACSGSSAGTAAQEPTTVPAPETSTTASTTTPAPTTSTAPDWNTPLICDGPCDPPVEVLFTLSVSDEGIGYANVGIEEMQASGPTAIAVAGGGVVWILDSVHRELLAFSLDGSPRKTVDLTSYEVASAVDLATGPAGMLLLDIYVAAQRYRLLELDDEGNLGDVHDLPAGVWLEDGLTGTAIGPAGERWLELQAGARVAALDVSTDPVSFTITNGYPYPDGLYGPEPGNTFVFGAGDVEISVEGSGPMGGLSLLGTNPDGSFVLMLDEVSMDANGVIRVDESVHLFDSEGYHLGEAVVPLTEQFLEVFHALTLGPDGNTYMLLTHPDRVEVVRLPYYR